MSFNINDLPNTIKIGYVGQEANSIEFDISAWKAKDQSVVCEITMVAPFSELEFEPMGVSQHKNALLWDLYSDALDIEGLGSITIHGIVDGVEKYNVSADVIIDAAIVTETLSSVSARVSTVEGALIEVIADVMGVSIDG